MIIKDDEQMIKYDSLIENVCIEFQRTVFFRIKK